MIMIHKKTQQKKFHLVLWVLQLMSSRVLKMSFLLGKDVLGREHLIFSWKDDFFFTLLPNAIFSCRNAILYITWLLFGIFVLRIFAVFCPFFFGSRQRFILEECLSVCKKVLMQFSPTFLL